MTSDLLAFVALVVWPVVAAATMVGIGLIAAIIVFGGLIRIVFGRENS